MAETNGIIARVARSEKDIDKLFEKKADVEDLLYLRGEVREVKRILLWFMGIAATAMVSGFGVVIGILVK